MIEQNGGAAPAAVRNAAPRPAAAAPVSTMSAPPVRSASAPRASAEPSLRPQMAALAPEVQGSPARRIANFPELVALAGERRDLLTKAALESDVRLVRIEDGRLEVALERNAQRTLINDLSRKLEQWTGRRWTVIVSNEVGQPTLKSQNAAAQSMRERAAESDPRVQEVLARFPGAKVVEVRRLAAEPPESHADGDDLADGGDGDDAE